MPLQQLPGVSSAFTSHRIAPPNDLESTRPVCPTLTYELLGVSKYWAAGDCVPDDQGGGERQLPHSPPRLSQSPPA